MGTDTATVPKGSDRFPQPRRVGCLLGCAGYSHDDDCDLVMARTRPPSGPCSLDYRCKTLSISVLADPQYETCPCWTGEDA